MLLGDNFDGLVGTEVGDGGPQAKGSESSRSVEGDGNFVNWRGRIGEGMIDGGGESGRGAADGLDLLIEVGLEEGIYTRERRGVISNLEADGVVGVWAVGVIGLDKYPTSAASVSVTSPSSS